MKTSYYQLLTLLFAFLLAVKIFLNPFGDLGKVQSQTNYVCESRGLDYATIDSDAETFVCCKVWDVADPVNSLEHYVEGCSKPFSLEGFG